MIYLLDATAVSDLIRERPNVPRLVDEHIIKGDEVALCRPIYYELMRGLLWKKAPRQIEKLQEEIIPNLDWKPLYDEDWLQAAEFWAGVVRAGRSLSDIDILLAAVAYRLDATIVSSDNDFEALPVKRENWREK